MMLYKGEEFSLFIILYDHFLYGFSLEHFFVLRKFVSKGRRGSYVKKIYHSKKSREEEKEVLCNCRCIRYLVSPIYIFIFLKLSKSNTSNYK